MPFDAMEFVVDPDVDVLDARSLFRAMVNGLVAQGVPSFIKEGICQYRARKSDGTVLKCAIGFVLTDEEAAEGDQIGGAAQWAQAKGVLFPDRLRPHLGLLSIAQRIHDRWAAILVNSTSPTRRVHLNTMRQCFEWLRGRTDIDQGDVSRLEKLILS